MGKDLLPITEKDGWLTFKSRVQPGASKSSISGLYGDSIKITLNAPPVDGKANEELIKFLSKTLDIPKSSISIISGETNRSKLIKCRISKSEFLSKIQI
ncbi:MAG: DUF167 domain-containing protein [Lentisphaerota bacterium]